MTKLLESRKTQIMSRWEAISSHLERNFQLTPPSIEDLKIAIEQDSELISEENVVLLDKNLISEGLSLHGILAKECLRLSLPPNCFCKECLDDLSFEFARQTLKGADRDVWTQKWSELYPRRRLNSVLVHEPSKSFPYLESLAGKKALRVIIKELLSLTQSGLSLSYEEYVSWIDGRFRRFSASLDWTELKIINLLLRSPKCQQKELANRCDLSVEWVSRKIKNLEKRAILHHHNNIPFSKIGIRMYFLLLLLERNHYENLYSSLSECPFLFSFRRVLSGDWSAISILCVPDNPYSVKSIHDACSILEKRGILSELREIASSGAMYCFNHFEPEDSEWFIPWESLEINLHRIYNYDMASTFPRIDKPVSKTQISLDQIDMQILSQFRSESPSIQQVRKVLGIGQRRTYEKIKRLRNEGLIEEKWDVRNIGLNENIIVRIEDECLGDAVRAVSLTLPRCVISYDTYHSLFLDISLPTGGSHGLLQALSSFTDSISSGIMGTPQKGSWGFPVHLWNDETQTWRFPEEEVAYWFQSLRINSHAP